MDTTSKPNYYSPESGLIHVPEPVIIRPFSEEVFQDLANHVKEVRRIFDIPGNPYFDANENVKFNRWAYHNLPLLKKLHNSRALLNLASDTFGQDVKPSYVFLSMYGPDGVCPLHQDRPQCQFTMDLLIHGAEEWPIMCVISHIFQNLAMRYATLEPDSLTIAIQ